MADQPAVPFRVSHSEQTRQLLKGWGVRARELGLAAGYAAALRFIEEKLQFDPLGWGDPLYQLHGLALKIFRGLHWSILVEYGVNEQERIVFIKKYELVLNNPLLLPTTPPNGNGTES